MSDSTIAVEASGLAATEQTLAQRLRVTVTSQVGEVETAWLGLERKGQLESPGQSFAFTKLWVDNLDVAESELKFVCAALDGQPLVLLPLARRTRWGTSMLTWLPGRHVGCNAPVVDTQRMLSLSSEERRTVWRSMTARLGADFLYLPAIPQLPQFAELGASIPGDTLYRAEFTNWQEADKTQRSKSRRKHDRQQGDRLDALGQVTFEEVDGGAGHLPILDIMFRQRSARFAAMGIPDLFADCPVRAFYDATLLQALPVKLHVLRLDGEVVAVRYNVVSGDRMFCLISSMSDDPRIQAGSPGKQCLLRVMQTVFDQGYRCFDMGAGFTDEKRHWCNVQIPLRQHYLPLTPLGHLAATAHRLAQSARREIKTNPRLLATAKRLRAVMHRNEPRAAASDAE